MIGQLPPVKSGEEVVRTGITSACKSLGPFSTELSCIPQALGVPSPVVLILFRITTGDVKRLQGQSERASALIQKNFLLFRVAREYRQT